MKHFCPPPCPRGLTLRGKIKQQRRPFRHFFEVGRGLIFLGFPGRWDPFPLGAVAPGAARCRTRFCLYKRQWKRGRFVFVNSMFDLFHEAVPLPFIRRVIDVMQDTPQHTYQVLTKRAERLAQANLSWPVNVWVGVSVENAEYWDRVNELRRVNARVKFLSIEPLLGPLTNLDFTGIDWVIVGGESGPGSRPINASWVREIRDACLRQRVAFHFKQWGGRNKKASGRALDKRTWDQMPERLCA
jgi:protein gp37